MRQSQSESPSVLRTLIMLINSAREGTDRAAVQTVSGDHTAGILPGDAGSLAVALN